MRMMEEGLLGGLVIVLVLRTRFLGSEWFVAKRSVRKAKGINISHFADRSNQAQAQAQKPEETANVIAMQCLFYSRLIERYLLLAFEDVFLDFSGRSFG